MKKLIIVSLGKVTGEVISDQIKALIGDRIIIEVVLISELTHFDSSCDLLLFTSEFIAEVGIKYFPENTPYLMAKRVINHKNIKDVISLEEGTKVLLVNDGEDSAFEATEQLNEIGLDHVKYYPYYPGCSSYPNLEIAITPGESYLTPPSVSRIIDIGARILDIRTIHEILAQMNMQEALEQSLLTGYIKDIVEITRSIDSSRKSVIQSQQLLETILNSVESGIAYLDSFERIISVNSKFESILSKKKKDLLMKKFSDLIDSVGILADNKSVITSIEEKEVLIDINKITLEKGEGFLVTVNYTDKISKLDHKIRRNYEKKLTRKLYTFDDYLSVSKSVKEVLKIAKKFSNTDATMLIQGENGTGKEIIAQAVHMNSYRRKNAFIPVNIAAIAPNLLESELFGYEEGAFTGAKKGGKAGLFEIANGGTIFIDEIGDAPMDFQVKLLRVLEDKRIRRVGALEEIPTNIRVIAATNKNLMDLIHKGEFREDLFFRLNILPLRTIPLRRRKDDIRYLLKHFIDIYFGKNIISSLNDIFEGDTLEFLEDYCWRGNVRELVNLVEYLSFIYEGAKIGLAYLPYYMMGNTSKERVLLNENELWVLKEIGGNSGIGRKKLTQWAEEQGLSIGEGKIRSIIKKLKDKELVENRNGKRGLSISEKGVEVLEKYK